MHEKILNSTKTLILIFVFIIIAGIFSYSSLPREADPDISLPVIYVSLAHEAISPDDSERLLVKPMEKELKKIEGVKKMSSTSFLGGGNIILEFDAGFNSEKALNDVRVKVDNVKNKLPDETKEPRVSEVNLSRFPVLTVAISGKIEPRLLIEISKRISDKIEGLSEVLEVKTIGEREREIEVLVNPITVKAYGLTTNDVIESLKRENILIPAGTLSNQTGSFNIRIPGLFEDRQDLLNIPIQSNAESSIKLGKIATIVDSFKRPKGYARNNGENAIILEISKRTGENIIYTINKIKAVVKKEVQLSDKIINVEFFQDESKSINTMISDLENNVILAVLLVLLIVIFWMGLHSAILVCLSIPGSFLLSMIFLSLFNVTINVVVLFSLILSVGILIDGAIIVVEYANRRASEKEKLSSIFHLAARKMTRPVIASTLTTLAAFFPLIFWPGVAGEFMFYLPITLLTILSSSLVMALIFIPMLGNLSKIRIRDNENFRTLSLLENGDLSQISGIQLKYLTFLKKCLNNPYKVILSTTFLLFAIQFSYVKIGKGFEFFPPIEPDYAEVVVHARGNLSLDDKDNIIKKVERLVLENDKISNIYSKIGNVKGERRDGSEDIIGSIKLEFIDWKNRPKAKDILKNLERRFETIPGVVIEIIEKKDGPPKDKDIEIEVSNQSNKKLLEDGKKIIKFLEKQSWTRNIDNGMNVPGIDWEIIVDRSQADKYEIDLIKVGNVIQMLTHGLKISDFMPENSDEEVDIVVKFEKSFQTLDELDRIEIESPSGPVSLSSFVQRNPVQKVGKKNRVDSLNSINIKLDVKQGIVANSKVQEIRKWILENQNIQSNIKFRGQEEDQEEAKEFLIKAFFISIFLILIILVATFENYYYCFIILTSVVMSTIGVMIGLIVSQQPFGVIMSGIGVISLAGIVVNNNIVLIDTFKTIKKNTKNTYEAVLRTSVQRLRPVLLTTLTTFFGLLPMALGLNINFLSQEISLGSPSSQWWLQLSNAIVFGIIFSFILTLIVTPCLILVGEKLFNKLKAF
ncbi:MAG: MFS transporter [Rickettsiales bacterium]|nr:MFS transporter [Rickettsiales bacterium]